MSARYDEAQLAEAGRKIFAGEADFIIAKHRNGPTGGGQLWFVKDQTRFVNLVRAASSGTEAAEESESVL